VRSRRRSVLKPTQPQPLRADIVQGAAIGLAHAASWHISKMLRDHVERHSEAIIKGGDRGPTVALAPERRQHQPRRELRAPRRHRKPLNQRCRNVG